ncbi:hypothetical protein BGX29_008996 [Mortierella sp. GBA35]|nr:hypothetical protein BGX29_008996 [Mortierella sp. GBA35]
MTPSPSPLAPGSPNLGYGPGGGPVPGVGQNIGYAAAFLGRRAVRDTWIAIWVLWLVWALLFLAKQTFGSTRVFDAPRSERVITSNTPVVTERGPYETTPGGVSPFPDGGGGGGVVGQDQSMVGENTSELGTAHRGGGAVAGGAGRGGFFQRAVDNGRDRIERTYNLVRDLTLMLLVVVTINTFGLGSGIAVLILTWIYLAITLFWAGLVMVIESRIIDVVLGSLQILILLAILIAAYAIGWVVLD